MLKIALIGAGYHSQATHAPALARYAQEYPGEISLAAVSDPKEEMAHQLAEQFGFARVYEDTERMLEAERPDACWVAVPIGATRAVAGSLLERHIPVLFEKPPGKNSEEARELAEISRRTGTPNLVAFNRRWAPCTQQALSWIKEHGPFEYIYGRMLRPWRPEADFAFGTGIHLLDCVWALAEAAAGGIASAQTVKAPSATGAFDFHVDLHLRSGARGRCDILPTCGRMEESYVLYGQGVAIAFSLPWPGGEAALEGSAELWVQGNLKAAEHWPGEPMFLSNGFYHEAEAFLTALREGRQPWPRAEEAVESVVLAEAVQAGQEVSFA